VSSNHRILVVEDERVLAENLKTFLTRCSADVRVAESGRDAMEMIESFTPDVLVLDYGLQGGNGLAFYRALMRHRARPIACVMITGYPLERISKPANAVGVRHLLGKPFSLYALQHLIELSAAQASGCAHGSAPHIGWTSAGGGCACAMITPP